MGNFMVLNLFLALLLNSFNSEELKSKKEVKFYRFLYFLKEILSVRICVWFASFKEIFFFNKKQKKRNIKSNYDEL